MCDRLKLPAVVRRLLLLDHRHVVVASRFLIIPLRGIDYRRVTAIQALYKEGRLVVCGGGASLLAPVGSLWTITTQMLLQLAA